MTDSRRTRVNERRSARGCDRVRGQQVGEEEQGEGQEDERGVRRGENDGARLMCNSHCVSWCRGWCRTNTERRRLLLRPLSRMTWREGGGMWGKGKK